MQAWRSGVVLCGPSAGSLCWFTEVLSAFHGSPRVVPGLGLLPYSNCVHYDAEPQRRAEYHALVGEGMRGGYAADDGVGLHFRGTRLTRVGQLAPRRPRVPRAGHRRRDRGDPARRRLPRSARAGGAAARDPAGAGAAQIAAA